MMGRMKNWLPGTALALSLLALATSAWTWHEADARADAAQRRREKSLVEKYRPAVAKVCQDFGVQEPPADAESLDDLLTPLEKLMTPLRR
jgi:hypothetical protein